MEAVLQDESLAEAVDAQLAKIDLYEFVKQTWPIIEPGRAMQDNWHIKVICDKLEAVSRGEIKRLIINVPPRSMKSTIVSVCWPVWQWLQDPSKQFLTISHSAGLATRDAVKSRRLMESNWFQHHFGSLFGFAKDQNQKTRYENTYNGHRIALGMTGSITGEGGDFIVIDDGLDAKKAHSEAAKRACREAYDDSIAGRLNDPKTGAIIIMGQRLAEDDLTGHVLDAEVDEWEHICFPMLYDPDHEFLYAEDPRTKKNETLWPERFDEKYIDKERKRLGAYGFSGQHQQVPAPPDGGIYKRAMFYEYKRDGNKVTFNVGGMPITQLIDVVFMVVDTAYTEKKTSDYTVMGVFGGNLNSERLWLLNLKREKIDLRKPMMHESKITGFMRDNGATVCYIEAKSFALNIISNMKDKGVPVRKVEADTDKIARAMNATPTLELNGLGIPINAEWVGDFYKEVLNFPVGKHDDQADVLAYSQQVWFAEYISGGTVSSFKIKGRY